MGTIIVIIIYASTLIFLDSLKVRTSWVVFFAFMAGYYANDFATHIINLLNK